MHDDVVDSTRCSEMMVYTVQRCRFRRYAVAQRMTTLALYNTTLKTVQCMSIYNVNVLLAALLHAALLDARAALTHRPNRPWHRAPCFHGPHVKLMHR